MKRRALSLGAMVALTTFGLGTPTRAAAGCYRAEPPVEGSTTVCAVRGTGLYAVTSAVQWELRTYRGDVCTGSPLDIDSSLTRTGRTPSAGVLAFGSDGRCVELNLTGPGVMVLASEAYA
jgi:hypothetical protein